MALIHCPECGLIVSDEAEVCIHCGYPLKKKREEAAQPDTEQHEMPIQNEQIQGNIDSPIQTPVQGENINNPEHKKFGKKKLIIIGACAVAAIVAVVLIVGAVGKTGSSKTAMTSSTSSKASSTTTSTKTANIAKATPTPTAKITPAPTVAPLSCSEVLAKVETNCKAKQYDAASMIIKQNKSHLSDSELEKCITKIGEYQCQSLAGDAIAKNLKSPKSYNPYDTMVTSGVKDPSSGGTFYGLTIKYGGTNGFGAEITSTATVACFYSLDKVNCKVIMGKVMVLSMGS
jgi:hypothetical protein